MLAQRLVRKRCPHCHGRRLQRLRPERLPGRTGIFELLVADDAIRSQIHRQAAESEIARRPAGGMVLMRDDGERLVRDGITSREELLRVTRGLSEVKADGLDPVPTPGLAGMLFFAHVAMLQAPDRGGMAAVAADPHHQSMRYRDETSSALAFACARALAPWRWAQNYPNKVIKLQVPFAPGGTDVVARIIADPLGKAPDRA